MSRCSAAPLLSAASSSSAAPPPAVAELPSLPPAAELPSPPPAAELPSPPPAAELPSPPPAAELPSPPPAAELSSPPPAAELSSPPPAVELPSPPPAAAAGAPLQYWHQCPHHHFACCHPGRFHHHPHGSHGLNQAAERTGCSGAEEGSTNPLGVVRRRRQITDVDTWVQCFAVYIGAMSHKYPEAVPELLAYMILIVRSSREFAELTWARYDTEYRRHAANSGNRQWSRINPSMYAVHFTGKAQASTPRCELCASVFHLAKDCPFSTKTEMEKTLEAVLSACTSRAGGSVTPVNPGSTDRESNEVCRKWNDERCNYQWCRYRHVCLSVVVKALNDCRLVITNIRPADLLALDRDQRTAPPVGQWEVWQLLTHRYDGKRGRGPFALIQMNSSQSIWYPVYEKGLELASATPDHAAVVRTICIRSVVSTMVHVSRFGVIPKGSSGKWRLILDLSSPEGASVNDGIDSGLCSLEYATVDQAVELMLRLGRGALMAKADIEQAYRRIPVHPDDRGLFGMRFEGATYMDNRSSIWSAIGSEGVQCCGRCSRMGVSEAREHKTVGPATSIVFLGINLDSCSLQLSLPEEKLRDLKALIQSWVGRKVTTAKDLKSLVGKLENACKVVRPGRLEWRVSGGRKILESAQPDVVVHCDVGSIGCAAWWSEGWLHYEWPPDVAAASIMPKETLPMVFACAVWGQLWRNKRIRVYCDNEAAVANLNSSRSKEPWSMHMIRCLVFIKAIYGTRSPPLSGPSTGFESVGLGAPGSPGRELFSAGLAASTRNSYRSGSKRYVENSVRLRV
eukprot:Em0003g803a